MTVASSTPAFCTGIQYFGEIDVHFEQYGQRAAIVPDAAAIDPDNPAAIYQMLLYADALRYLILQMTASKSSGHPGGFASQAEVYAALVLLGHKNFVTEVGHHAPGFYAAMFLDTSLEAMGIQTVQDLRDRFRERHGLLGHLSGQIPGLLAPAGPLGQGQHFAMAGALLNPGKLFPCTIGDGGLGEPYIMSAIAHFNTAYPHVTNFLPVLVWNGFSQEHHSMVSLKTNASMEAYWKGNGFAEVVLIDAKDFDDQNQPGDYVDSTIFSFEQRMAFSQAVLAAADQAAQSALGGQLTVLIIKQLKGAGVHARGAQSHNLYPHHTLENPDIIAGLQSCALSPEAWQLVRTNCERAGGGAASKVAVTEFERSLPDLGMLPLQEFPPDDRQVATTAMGTIVGAVGQQDPAFVVMNADGNAASGIGNINQALKINHPTEDAIYNQGPGGQVYEPLSEDACAGLAAGMALFGGRTLWCSYESFAINGLPIWQTVTQAMAELRRPTPATVCLFTAGALEQGRNGWTHQRPEVEAYFAAMMRNGNIFPLFPTDANSIQVCYEWALAQKNKGIVITASKSALPVRTTFEQTRAGLETGGIILHDSCGQQQLVLAVVGDLVLGPVFEAAAQLETQGYGVRIVSVINPRRLFRPTDVLWETCAAADGDFLSDADFTAMFGGDALLGVAGGTANTLEPVMLRSQAKRDVLAWQRGETTASAAELLAFNRITAETIVDRVTQLL
ncbi:phosphoketolase [filamentous cyanobacterium LEGE 11480]|uniref:Phosphoketolase n=1 Tax=Romeriopsis navalis LEGE 11480 TaxID=2777977 RepID=A0A928VQQ5_9CYAN|nr:phosphoketolase [Romeriopsis navalis]MBE9032931.1 phosphoketolase [Romeriopsis navalis LEGE 11480]